MNKTTNKPQPIKSTREMRTFLLDQMSLVANGDVDVGRAKGVCNLAQQVYNTLNIEIKHAKALDDLGQDELSEVGF